MTKKRHTAVLCIRDFRGPASNPFRPFCLCFSRVEVVTSLQNIRDVDFRKLLLKAGQDGVVVLRQVQFGTVKIGQQLGIDLGVCHGSFGPFQLNLRLLAGGYGWVSSDAYLEYIRVYVEESHPWRSVQAMLCEMATWLIR